MSGADLARARRLLATPVGLPESGRLRYGAAMALHAAGEMSFAALEVYRLVAMTDAEDPVALLRARRLPVPPAPPPDPAADLLDLVEALETCLAARRLSRAAEIRRALGQIRLMPPRPLPAATLPAVVARHLPAVLGQVAAIRPDLAAALAAAAPALGWGTVDATGAVAHAAVPGPGAPWPGGTAEIGLSLLAPGTVRPCVGATGAAHVILPLTGPHGWQAGPSRPVAALPALAPIAPGPGSGAILVAGERPLLALVGRMAAVPGGALSPPPARSG